MCLAVPFPYGLSCLFILARWKRDFFSSGFCRISFRIQMSFKFWGIGEQFRQAPRDSDNLTIPFEPTAESLSTIFWSKGSFTEVPFETADSSLWESQHSSHCTKEMHLFVWKSGWPSFETGSSWSDTKRQQYGTSCSHYSGPSTSPSTGHSTY